MKNNRIKTYSGIWFDVFNPKPKNIDIEDIAHALSNICRFNGHTDKFYSVAQHSVFCAFLASDKNKLRALLHDASEAYICDIPRPLKHHPSMKPYLEVEANLQTKIYTRFGITGPEPEEIHAIDNAVLNLEIQNLGFIGFDYKTDFKIPELNFTANKPDIAKNDFLSMFNQLVGV